MIKYLMVLLDDKSTSYCHYDNKSRNALISIEDLKAGIFYAMKENLSIQFVYPDEPLPDEYTRLINSIDHSKYVSSTCEDEQLLQSSDVIVFNSWTGVDTYNYKEGKVYVLRTSFQDFFDRHAYLNTFLNRVDRFNIIFTDIDTFKETDIERYKNILETIGEKLKEEYVKGHYVQINLLTDRMLLSQMNNCNAGVENITLAPDGKFYVCPAFYYGQKESIGSPTDGLNIKNPQLYKYEYAPICRHCDVYHCKRCVWLNQKLTLEVNTPGHEQCVVAHIERNAAKNLLESLRKLGEFMPEQKIDELNYLDPFDNRSNW